MLPGFIYYSPAIPITFGPALISLELQSYSDWTTPERLNDLISTLSTIDFQDFDSRQRALSTIRTLPIPQLFYAYPFDPVQYPFGPPFPQSRFPSPGTYVELQPEYQYQFIILQGALSYRDPQDPTVPQANYTAALTALRTLVIGLIGYIDRSLFELTNLSNWFIYPPPPLVPEVTTPEATPAPETTSSATNPEIETPNIPQCPIPPPCPTSL